MKQEAKYQGCGQDYNGVSLQKHTAGKLILDVGYVTPVIKGNYFVIQCSVLRLC